MNFLDRYSDPYGSRYDQEVPSRERPPAGNRDRDPYDRQPARYDERQYDDREPGRYDERQPARYDDRQSSIYDEPPRSLLSEPRSVGRPVEGSRRDDYDAYGTPAGGRQLAREAVSRGAPSRETQRETSLRNQYVYDRPAESRGSAYSNERYPERLPPRSDDHRGAYDATSYGDRQALLDRAPARDPYEPARKRPASGYAGYDDVYDQPPSRVARTAPTSQYGY